MNIDWLRIGEAALAVIVLWLLLSWGSMLRERWWLRKDAEKRETQKYLQRVRDRD